MNDIKMIAVVSSNVASVGFDDKSNNMIVCFNNNAYYVYRNVPKEEFERLINANSVGSYLHRNIKHRYTYERLK